MKSKRNQSHQNSTPSHLPETTIVLADYVAHARNYNGHSGQQLTKLRASLRKFGQVKNIVVWRNMFVAGHGLAQAATLEGWTTLRANVIPEDWPEERVMAYLAADNELARQSDPDQAALAALIDEVGQFDPELMLAIGYSQDEFEKLLAEVGGGKEPVKDPGADTSKADELQAKWGVESGQLWQLGAHKLICGDSSDRATVERLMNGERASCIFTDPPYGVAIGAKNRMLNSFQKAGRNLTDIEDDTLSPDELKQRLLPSFRIMREIAMADDCTVFMTAPQGGELCMMMMMMKEAGLPVRHVLIWKKNAPTFSMGRLDYDYQHEPILMTWGKRHKRPMKGDHRTSVWEIDKPRASPEHPTMKPVELVVNALLNNSDRGDIAYEPFSGSGTCIMACEMEGRQCRAIELVPGYVAVALERWHVATNQTPVRLEPNP